MTEERVSPETPLEIPMPPVKPPRAPEAHWSEPMDYVRPHPHPHELPAWRSEPESDGSEPQLFSVLAAVCILWISAGALLYGAAVGWWLVPAAISATVFIGAAALLRTSGSRWDGELDRAIDVIIVLLAIIISLAAWLIWSLLK